VDNDGLVDGQERARGTDPKVADSDGDGLNDGTEVALGTNPLVTDTDADGLSDAREHNDTLTNPVDADTDHDGLRDALEVDTYSTDPSVADTDHDGLKDGAEVNTYRSDPNMVDTDSGGTNDADEGAGAGGGGTPPGEDKALPPEVEIVSGGVVPLKSNGRIPVRIVCIYRADRCKGTLTLKAATAIKAKVGRKVQTIKKGATIAKADLAPIRWGNSDPVQLKASALFRALVPRLSKPKAKVQAILVSQDTAGGDDAPEARATGDLTVGAKAARRR
jgi:hypothetical protein